MRTRLFGSVAALVAGAGLAAAQPPTSMSPFPPMAQPPLLTPELCPPARSMALPGAPLFHRPVRQTAATATPADDPVREIALHPESGPIGEGVPVAEGCCDSTGPCEPEWVGWARVEYLLFWIKDAQTPPLATLGPVATNGVLGSPGTAVVATPAGGDFDDQHGGRFTLGFWLDQYTDFGLEGNYFFLGTERLSRSAAAAGQLDGLTLSRPFLNVLVNQEDVLRVTPPGSTAGAVVGTLDTRMAGAEFNARLNLCRGCSYRLDLLGGFRYWELAEGLHVAQSTTLAPGAVLTLADQFGTRNRFYGGQVGLDLGLGRGRLFLDATAKLGLGGTEQVLHADGLTVLRQAGLPTQVGVGGLLALPTNRGRSVRNEFTLLPELGVRVGYQVRPWLRAFAGYTLLYSTSVIRPGEQIDRGLNPGFIPSARVPVLPGSPVRPAVALDGTDFWAQGVSLGLEFRF
jgi:hypothetical protein